MAKQQITLRISEAIRNEWMVRGIGEVIPALDGIEIGDAITVPESVVREVLADCQYMTDKDGPDTTLGERSAYRALAVQCRKALAA